MEWNEVNEQLPPEYKQVLLYFQSLNAYFLGFRNGNEWFDDNGNRLFAGRRKPSHWCELQRPK